MKLMDILRREVSKQFVRFALIGLESTILNYLVFIIMLNFLAIHYLPSAATGFISGVFLGFIFNKIYTFRSDRKLSISFPIYLLVYAVSLSFTLLALRFLVESVGITPLFSNLMILPITTLMNFFGTKILAFKNKDW